MSIEELKEKVARGCRIIEMEGATENGRGHVCCLHPDGDKILIPGHLHDFGKAIADVQAEDIVTIDFEGKVLEGKHSTPMGEFYVYTAAFRARKDVRACAHYHPPYANAVGASGQSILPIARDGCLFLEGVPIYQGFPLYVGNQPMGDEIVRQLGQSRALIHRGHGAFVVGKSIEEVVMTSLALENAARTQIWAATQGPLQTLPVDQISERETNPDEEIIQDFFGYYSGKLAKLEGRTL